MWIGRHHWYVVQATWEPSSLKLKVLVKNMVQLKVPRMTAVASSQGAVHKHDAGVATVQAMESARAGGRGPRWRASITVLVSVAASSVEGPGPAHWQASGRAAVRV